mgnify:CR=1 FL=1
MVNAYRLFQHPLYWEQLENITPKKFERLKKHSFPTSFGVRVPITVAVKRESEDSSDFLVTLQSTATNAMLAIYLPNSPNPQWFLRDVIYQEVLAQAYEYSEPRLGISRWPTLSETANRLLFNLTESGGGNQVPTVDARLKAVATVDSVWASREMVVVERMDDGQWRVAGYGYSEAGVLKSLGLKVTTSGTLYAIGMDDYGKQFAPGIELAVGERVRPTQYTGWLYEVTQAGQLPSVEPEWWPASDVNPPRLVGTVWLKAVRYYQPVAHGPVPAEFV